MLLQGRQVCVYKFLTFYSLTIVFIHCLSVLTSSGLAHVLFDPWKERTDFSVHTRFELLATRRWTITDQSNKFPTCWGCFRIWINQRLTAVAGALNNRNFKKESALKAEDLPRIFTIFTKCTHLTLSDSLTIYVVRILTDVV